jgi:hypothetical protein
LAQRSPNSWSVRTTVLPSGERLPFLTRGQLGLPDAAVTEFVLTSLRPKGRAARTISRYLLSIAAGFEFVASKNINLLQRIAQGAYLSTEELRAFSSLCQRGKSKAKVGGSVAADRYTQFMVYIEWLAAPLISRASSEVSFDRAQKAFQRFVRRAATVSPVKETAISSPDEGGGLKQAQRDLLKEAIGPDSQLNPWRDAAVKHRNFTMISLAYELGPRAGDVLSLKIRDVESTRLL